MINSNLILKAILSLSLVTSSVLWANPNSSKDPASKISPNDFIVNESLFYMQKVADYAILEKSLLDDRELLNEMKSLCEMVVEKNPEATIQLGDILYPWHDHDAKYFDEVFKSFDPDRMKEIREAMKLSSQEAKEGNS